MSEPITINVMYSCNLCDLHRVSSPVRERAAGEDIKSWMNAVTVAVSADHARRSPHCHPATLSDIMIPITGADIIGGVTKH